MENQHKWRMRYSGTHPKNYREKYKEHNQEKYADPIESAKTKERLEKQGFCEEILTVRLQNFADIDQVSRDVGRLLNSLGLSFNMSSLKTGGRPHFQFRSINGVMPLALQ